MIEYTENGIRILEPEGENWLTNGEIYSKKVFLGKDASASEWEEKPWDGTYPEEEELTDAEALEILIGGDGL